MIVPVTTTIPDAVVFNLLPSVIVAPVVPAVFTDHAIVLFVALAGLTVPVKVTTVFFTPLVGTPLIEVTATKLLLF
jgi:hypothetical protein